MKPTKITEALNSINKKFNKLTLLEVLPNSECKVRCDCGNICVMRISDLLRKQKATKQCKQCHSGTKSALWKGYQDISMTFYSRLITQAKYRQIEFNLSIEYLWELFIQQNKKCKLTGLDLKFPLTRHETKTSNISLDRIDSSKGYIVGNVQWVHKTVNLIKNNLDCKLFIELCHFVSRANPIDNLNSENFEEQCLQRHVPGTATGDMHFRAKTCTLQNENGNIFHIKGIKQFCKEHGLSTKALRLNSRKGHFCKGWKIIKYDDSTK